MGARGTKLVKDRERAARALSLRLAGLSYPQIAEQMGYRDKSGAHRAVMRLLERRESEGAEEIRAIEDARLDRLQTAVWPAASRGDLDAVRTSLSIIDRRMRLHGMAAPTNVNIALTDADFYAQLREVLGDLGPDGIRNVVQGLPSAQPAIEAQRPAVIEVIDAVVVEDDNTDSPDNADQGEVVDFVAALDKSVIHADAERPTTGQPRLTAASVNATDGWSNIGH